MINIKNFDSDLLKIDKKSYKNIDIYYTGYITIKVTDYINIQSVNCLYPLFDKVDGYIEGSYGNKYLTLFSNDKNKEVLTKILLIKKINDKPGKYGEKIMKTKFDSDDDLHLNIRLKLHNMTIIVSVFFKKTTSIIQTFFKVGVCINARI